MLQQPLLTWLRKKLFWCRVKVFSLELSAETSRALHFEGRSYKAFLSTIEGRSPADFSPISREFFLDGKRRKVAFLPVSDEDFRLAWHRFWMGANAPTLSIRECTYGQGTLHCPAPNNYRQRELVRLEGLGQLHKELLCEHVPAQYQAMLRDLFIMFPDWGARLGVDLPLYVRAVEDPDKDSWRILDARVKQIGSGILHFPHCWFSQNNLTKGST